MSDPPPTTFQTLQEALAFFVECLEAEDNERVGAACPTLQATGRSSYGYHALEILRKKHAERSLLDRYRRRRFPWLRRRLKLGGHAKELGHLHIDFVRASDGWSLENIWLCR